MAPAALPALAVPGMLSLPSAWGASDSVIICPRRGASRADDETPASPPRWLLTTGPVAGSPVLAAPATSAPPWLLSSLSPVFAPAPASAPAQVLAEGSTLVGGSAGGQTTGWALTPIATPSAAAGSGRGAGKGGSREGPSQVLRTLATAPRTRGPSSSTGRTGAGFPSRNAEVFSGTAEVGIPSVASLATPCATAAPPAWPMACPWPPGLSRRGGSDSSPAPSPLGGTLFGGRPSWRAMRPERLASLSSSAWEGLLCAAA